MSRNSLHTEENFWPSVSDMFLTLFVIALALYSQSNDKKGSGDEYIAHLATREATELVENLRVACPNDTVIQAFDVAALSEEDTRDNKRTALAGYVIDIAEKSDQREYFRLGAYTEEELEAARGDYTKAIEIAYKSCVDVNPTEKPRYAAEQLHLVGKAMLRSIRMKDANTRKTPEQLEAALSEAKMQLLKQEERIRHMHSEEEYHRLELKISELEKIIAQSANMQQMRDEIEKLQKRIDELTQENETLKKRNGSLAAENHDLSSRLNEDTRRLVMESVVSVLKQAGLTNMVQVEEDLGVIRIPSSSVSFPSGVYKKFSGEMVLERVASALVSIAERNNEDHRIDNIVIECHADTDGDAFENEILSSNRALYIWKTLNDKSRHRLENYKNSSGLGLFSHAGFGCRVPMPLRPGESKYSDAYKERCRRIDIRFNCTPVKNKNGDVQEPHAPNEPDTDDEDPLLSYPDIE